MIVDVVVVLLVVAEDCCSFPIESWIELREKFPVKQENCLQSKERRKKLVISKNCFLD